MAVGTTSSLLSGPTRSQGGGNALSILGQRQNAGQALQSILTSSQVSQSRTNFFNNVALRIEALRLGQIEPQEDWEKVAAFLATKGQPFVVGVDRQGRVQVDRQSDTDLARFNEAEKRKLTDAFAEVDELARRIAANKQNQGWIDQLETVPSTLDGLRRWELPPDQGWQTEAARMQKAGIPFRVALDSKGQLSVIDQTATTFSDAPAAHQRVLLNAIAVVRQTITTGFSDGQYWSAQAQAYGEAGLDYFIDVDPITLAPVVKRNDSETVVPSFLRKAPFPDIGADQPWKQAAADLIEQGKGFYLDLDSRGEIVVRPNDGRNINLLDKPRNATATNPVINLLA